MAGAGTINAIGVLSSIVTLVAFTTDQFPSYTPQGATVRIKAGLPEPANDGDSLGGSLNHIYAFDEFNSYNGETDGCGVASGGVCEVVVDQKVAGRRAVYLGISNNNDATCIAWITVSQFDASRGGAWTGDIGKHCGMPWHYNGEKAGFYEENGETKPYRPYCTWLDGDHTNDIPAASMKYNVDRFGEEIAPTTVNEDICQYVIFGANNAPISGQPGPPFKRSLAQQPRRPWMEESLIVSNITTHTAAELCNSETSWGPDFIGSDGKFCDMGTKTLMPLCVTEDVDGCIDVEEEGNSVLKRMSVAKRAVSVVHKSYKKVSQWDE